MRKKGKDRKQREKGVNEQKGCSESSDPNRKHSDNGFSVELLEMAAADPQHLRPRTRQLLPTINTGGGAIEWEERRKETAQPTERLTQATTIDKVSNNIFDDDKAGIQNHIQSE